MSDTELTAQLADIIGFIPQDLTYYRHALMHSSCTGSEIKADYNNERLEFLGDAILTAVVADILYRIYPDEQEGFLTKLRSKIVQRPTLNALALDMGLDKIVLYRTDVTVNHLSLFGNAFEALVGAIYLDRGYEECRIFMNDIVFAKYLNIRKLQLQDLNYKSKLLEWCQKFNYKLCYELLEETMVNKNEHQFKYRVMINNVAAGFGNGFSKKEAQQLAAHEALNFVRRKSKFFNKLNVE